MNMACILSHPCLGSLVVRKKEFRPKKFISLEEINLSRQKQNYRFYLFDKSWNFPAKHVICSFVDSSGYASGPIRRYLFIDYNNNYNNHVYSWFKRMKLKL